jgi:hypothetical protein
MCVYVSLFYLTLKRYTNAPGASSTKTTMEYRPNSRPDTKCEDMGSAAALHLESTRKLMKEMTFQLMQFKIVLQAKNKIISELEKQAYHVPCLIINL